MEDLAIIKKEFANKRAAEYRSRGYEVLRDAPLDFMPGFCANLLARKNGETRGNRGADPNRAVGNSGPGGTGGSHQRYARLEL